MKLNCNTWPGGHRHAMHQSDHEAWNARNYPGTRQLCSECDGETDRCEDDSIYADDDGEIGPLCVECWHQRPEYLLGNANMDLPETITHDSETKNQPTK